MSEEGVYRSAKRRLYVQIPPLQHRAEECIQVAGGLRAAALRRRSRYCCGCGTGKATVSIVAGSSRNLM